MREYPEDEARLLMALPKWGEPMGEWRQDKNHAQTVMNAFGVVDSEGATIPGLLVELIVYRSQRVVMDRYVYTLFKLELGAKRRVYQLHVNHKRGVRPGDHEYTHEHIGSRRVNADVGWAFLNPVATAERFCVNCNLILQPPIPDFDAYTLR